MSKSSNLENYELSSSHVLLYNIQHLSEEWHFEDPYFFSLKSLLAEKDSITNVEFRTQRFFDFLAKIITDEINQGNNEVKKNIKILDSFMQNYLENKSIDDGDKIIQIVFLINVLNLIQHKKHYKITKIKRIKEVLDLIKPNEGVIINMKIILCQLYSLENEDIMQIKDNYDIALSMLHDKLLLANSDTRTENTLIEYYLKQKELENGINFKVRSDSAKGKVLEIGIILKTVLTNGLYLPEMEKNQYLSNYANKTLLTKYYQIIEIASTIEFLKIKIPIWGIVGLIFLTEIILFLLPGAWGSIPIPIIGLELNPEYLRSLSKPILLFLNAFFICAILIYNDLSSKKQVRDMKW